MLVNKDAADKARRAFNGSSVTFARCTRWHKKLRKSPSLGVHDGCNNSRSTVEPSPNKGIRVRLQVNSYAFAIDCYPLIQPGRIIVAAKEAMASGHWQKWTFERASEDL